MYELSAKQNYFNIFFIGGMISTIVSFHHFYFHVFGSHFTGKKTCKDVKKATIFQRSNTKNQSNVVCSSCYARRHGIGRITSPFLVINPHLLTREHFFPHNFYVIFLFFLFGFFYPLF